MVSRVLFCMLVASLLYAYTNHNREFTATVSAIRQIWFGNCRLSCRQSEYSSRSGLSGVAQYQGRDRGPRLSDEAKQGQSSINHQAGPSTNCVCDTCPCAVLEKVLRICSPVTTLYSQVLNLLSNVYYDLVRTLTDLYDHIERAVNCRASCQRPGQLTSPKVNSADNIKFVNASSPVKDDSAKKLGKQILNLKPSAISFQRQSDDELANAERNIKTGGDNLDINLPPDSKPKSESKESAQVPKSCSRCIEKENCCIVLYFAKAALLALAAVFVLCLPLGDPINYCYDAPPAQNKREGSCGLCDVYLMTIRIVSRAKDMMEVIIYAVGSVLYEVKLKFYSILEKIDRDDLCRSVCCSDSTESIDVKKEHRHAPCRCTKKCSKKKLDKI